MRLTCASLGLGVLVVLGGCHAQVGPVVGWAIGRGATYGLEGGGGVAIVRGNAGVSVRPAAAEDAKGKPEPRSTKAGTLPPEKGSTPQWPRHESEVVPYLVFEPFLGTVGIAHSDEGLGVAAGAWLGSRVTPPGKDCEAPFMTAAIGYRYMGGVHELYLTPKVAVLECVRFPL